MEKELPKSANKLYAHGEMNGWRVKVVWAEGPFQLGIREYQHSMSVRFSKRGKNGCAAIYLDDKWDAGMMQNFPGVVRTQRDLLAYLAGDLDVDAMREKLYPPPPDEPPAKAEYVVVDKKKMTLEDFHRIAKPFKPRVVPDWVKDKKR